MARSKTKAAIVYSGVSRVRVAKKLKTTIQNLGQRLKRDSFSIDELSAIADAIGAQFIPTCFVFPDGTKYNTSIQALPLGWVCFIGQVRYSGQVRF